MSLPYKLDPDTSKAIKSLLSNLNIRSKRILIDFEKETVESEEDFSVDDLLSVAGSLSEQRAKELQEEIKNSRKEWD